MVLIRRARVEDAPAIARVRVDMWKRTYSSFLDPAYLDTLSYAADEIAFRERIGSNEQGDRAVFVAEANGGEIVAFAGCGPKRECDDPAQGELYTLYVLDTCQGKGVGKLMFHAACEHLKGIGCRSVSLWCFGDNPNRRFYEHLGGRLVDSGPLTIMGRDYLDVNYAWDDIDSLMMRLGGNVPAQER